MEGRQVTDPRITKTSDMAKKPTRKSPMTTILESVQGDYWTMKDVAAHINVNIETIRRLTRRKNEDGSDLVKAPSYAVQHGGVVIYLFDKKDVVEIEQYFIDYGYEITNRIDRRRKLVDQKPEATS